MAEPHCYINKIALIKPSEAKSLEHNSSQITHELPVITSPKKFLSSKVPISLYLVSRACTLLCICTAQNQTLLSPVKVIMHIFFAQKFEQNSCNIALHYNFIINMAWVVFAPSVSNILPHSAIIIYVLLIRTASFWDSVQSHFLKPISVSSLCFPLVSPAWKQEEIPHNIQKLHLYVGRLQWDSTMHGSYLLHRFQHTMQLHLTYWDIWTLLNVNQGEVVSAGKWFADKLVDPVPAITLTYLYNTL